MCRINYSCIQLHHDRSGGYATYAGETTTHIGLAANGTGNIASFTAANSGNSPVTATITVTPSFEGCAGTPQSFTITVNPTGQVNDPADQTRCNGAPPLLLILLQSGQEAQLPMHGRTVTQA